MEKYKPISHDVEEGQNYFWCSCGKSKNQPFCDGSHNSLEFKEKEENSFSARVEPDSKKIDIAVNETILTASLRNNVAHLSACGGTGKCSTCRVEITDGLENCS